MNLQHIKKTLLILTLFLTPIFAQHNISGNVEQEGVTLSWFDGTIKTVTSGIGGTYSFDVIDNWSGTVTPTKIGYTFDPANKDYSNVIEDQTNEDYTANIDSNAISGNTGVGSVTFSWTDGSARSFTSDGTGSYSLNVSYDWSGTVTPSKTGYTFDPSSNNYNNVISDITSEDYSATLDSNTISGNTEVGLVTLGWTDGSARNITSDGAGDYSLNVSYDWSGTVTPSKTGYTFDPTNNDYNNVIADITNEDYSATLDTYIISGNTETGNATLSWTDGTPQTTTSDNSGNYSLSVSYDWTGTVTPSKTGYTFDPTSNDYNNVISDITNEDYSATLDSYIISGNTETGNATLSWTDGTPQTTTSDNSGNYSLSVSYDWTGTVTPTKTGYTFDPTSNNYNNVISDITNEDYSATLDSNTISGNTEVGLVTLGWTDGSARNITSDGAGDYSLNVSYDWSGTITPTKTGYTFDPTSKSYNNVITGQTNQDYTSTLNSYAISGNTGVGTVTLNWTDVVVKTTTSDITGNYSIGVPFNWSGTVTPSKTGYTFNPINKNYENVDENQINQDYADVINQYTIATTKNPMIGGNIDGLKLNGLYNHGEQVSLTAIPNTGYSFVNWTSTNTIIGVNLIISFTATKDTNLVANFSLNEYTITTEVNPSGTGIVTGLKPSGKYNHGDQVSLTATPRIEYLFVNWTSGETIVGTNNTIAFTATNDSSLIANFELKKYTISTSSSPGEGGTTVGDSIYTHGTNVTVTAIPNSDDGYDFINWTEDDSEVSTDVEYSFTAGINRSLVANFRLRVYGVQLFASPIDGGDVTGADDYIHGTSVTAIATPKPGWLFANWSEVILNDTSVISDTTHYSFSITSDRYLIANFSHNIYSINASSNPIDGGSISGSGSFFYGQTATLKANANAGWQFVNWTNNGIEVSTDSQYSFSVTENNSYVAHFARTDFNITCSAYPIDGGFTSGCGFSRYNQEITITAEAYENREFRNWTENGDEVSTDAQYTFNVTSNRNLVANFDRINGVEKMDGSDIIPQNYYISNAYPNPFNPETSFQFGLPEESFVNLIIFDISGQVIETVLNNSLVQAGNYVNHFNAVKLPSGIYLFFINANSAISDRSFKKSGKLLLLK